MSLEFGGRGSARSIPQESRRFLCGSSEAAQTRGSRFICSRGGLTRKVHLVPDHFLLQDVEQRGTVGFWPGSSTKMRGIRRDDLAQERGESRGNPHHFGGVVIQRRKGLWLIQGIVGCLRQPVAHRGAVKNKRVERCGIIDRGFQQMVCG